MLAFPPDITFLIQLVSFFVLLAILNKLLFVPYGEVLAERAARTEGAVQQADEGRAQADELAQRISVGLLEARKLAAEEASAIREQTRREESEILDKAKADATGRLSELRVEIGNERDAAKAALHGDTRALAGEMVSAILDARGKS
jgi:F-type H+-transporting ATPase subunit b